MTTCGRARRKDLAKLEHDRSNVDDVHDRRQSLHQQHLRLAQLGDGKIAVSTSGTGGGLSLFDGTTFVEANVSAGRGSTVDGRSNRSLVGGRDQSRTHRLLRPLLDQQRPDRFDTSSTTRATARTSCGSRIRAGGVSIRSAFLPALADVQPQINPANGIVPNRGSQGDTIVINGSGFGTNRAEVEVMIGGAPIDISTVTRYQITLRLRGDNLTGDVTVRRGKRSVTLGGGATPPFCAVPSITGVTPTGGNVGVEIKITGSNFDGARPCSWAAAV